MHFHLLGRPDASLAPLQLLWAGGDLKRLCAGQTLAWTLCGLCRAFGPDARSAAGRGAFRSRFVYRYIRMVDMKS